MKITHVMNDGSKRSSIEGMTVPKDHPVYNVLAEAYREGGIGSSETAKEADEKSKGIA